MKRSPLKQSKILPRKVPMPRKRQKSTPERKAARGMPCMLNVAGVCNYDSATTVLAHLRWLGECGTGKKPPDAYGVPACSACNTWTDSPTPAQTRDRAKYESDRNFYAARALARIRKLDMEKAA